MTGGYSVPFTAYVLSNWPDFRETGRLPRKTWELSVRSGRRVHGGAHFETPAGLKVDVEGALARLDDETRRVIHLRYLSGLPRYRVAQRLGVRTCRALEPLVEAAVARVAAILNGETTEDDDMASNGHTNGRTLEEQRGAELEEVYDRIDGKLRDLPPGWQQIVVKRAPGTRMLNVNVVY